MKVASSVTVALVVITTIGQWLDSELQLIIESALYLDLQI